MTAMWIGLALVIFGALVIGITGEWLRRRLRRGRSDQSTQHSLWQRLFRRPDE